MKKRRYWAVFILCYCCFFADVCSQSIVILSKEDSLPLLAQAMVFEDSKGQLSWLEVLQQEKWQEVSSQDRNFGMSASHFWFKIELGFSEDHLRIFQVAYPPIDHLEFYLVSQKKIVKQTLTGDLLPFSQRDILDHHFVFSHHVKANQPLTLLIKIQTQGTVVLPLITASVENYAASRIQSQTIYGIYFGISIAMLIYNLILFFYLRDPSYLYYCFFVATILFNSLAYTGMGFQWFWSDYPILNQYAIPVSVATGFLTATLFTQSFLQLKQRGQWIQYIFYACIVSSIIAITFTVFATYSQGIKFVASLQFILAFIFLFTGVYFWSKGVKEAKYFTIAWLSFLIGSTLSATRTLGFIPSNSITIYANLYGTIAEMLLLSLALAYRFETLRSQKNKLSQELESAEQQATNNLEKYRDLFNNSPAGLFHYWRENNVFDVNKYARGLIPQGLSLKSFLRAQLTFGQYKTLLSKGQLIEVTINIGKKAWYSLSMSVIRDEKHRVTELEGTLINITTRMQNEQLALDVEQEKLNSLTQLILGISHQFNTPLGVILTAQGVTNNAIEKLQEQLVKPQPSLREINKVIDVMKQSMTLSCNNSERLLVSMGELKSAIKEQSELIFTCFNPQVVIYQAFQTVKPEGTLVQLIVNNEETCEINSDVSIFIDIFMRLFSNSFDHAFEQQKNALIEVTLQQKKDYLRFHFHDNGRGLTDVEQQNIFVPFYTGVTRGLKNTGLGMYIVHNQVTQVLAGKIKVTALSSPELNSGFAIEILLPNIPLVNS